MIKILTLQQGKFVFKVIIALCFIIAVGTTVWFVTHTENHSALNSPLCWQNDNRCDMTISVGDISIIVDALPKVEEQIAVSVTLPADLAVTSAFIEGQNMYMGKIPLFLEQTSTGSWEGWFMLGSCSEPQMQWRLTLKLTDRPEPVWVYFNTSQQ